jgi:hypothetical protein
MLKGMMGSVSSAFFPLKLVGAMSYDGASSSNLLVSDVTDLKMKGKDFTIEWYQYQTDTNPNPRIFSKGTYPNADVAVSIESNVFYYWEGGSAISIATLSNYKNRWVHFAVTRASGAIRVFMDGVLLNTFSSNHNYNSNSQLRIANEEVLSSGSYFGGHLTNFHWAVGLAKYTSNFERPSSPISPIAQTDLLLLATDLANVTTDSSVNSLTAVNNNVTWSAFRKVMS